MSVCSTMSHNLPRSLSVKPCTQGCDQVWLFFSVHRTFPFSLSCCAIFSSSKFVAGRSGCKTVSSARVIHLHLEAEYNEEWRLFISNVYACGRNPEEREQGLERG